jgi:putative hemolysin
MSSRARNRVGALGEEALAPAGDPRALMRTLPPLVKGYRRLGATFSPVPAVDPAFGATDVFVVLPLRDIETRYLEHFGVQALPPPLAA